MKNYKIGTDINVAAVGDGSDGYLISPEDVLYVDKPTDRDLLDSSGEEDYRPEIITASPNEVEKWAQGFQQFAEQMAQSQAAVEKARKGFEEAVALVRAGAQRAWENYAEIHNIISDRIAEVEKLRDQDQALRHKQHQEAADAALAAEDAEHGPREFRVTRPSQRGQESRLMDVPTVHHISCPSLPRMKSLPPAVRIQEAFGALMDGGQEATKSFYHYEVRPDARRLEGSACERCPAFDRLRAHAPDTFDDWLERTESTQRATMPPDTYNGSRTLFKRLGLEICTTQNGGGWSRISDRYYREPNEMADDEILIGWVTISDDHKRTVISAAERLTELFHTLPDKGFEVRWIHEFTNMEEVSPYCVAIRPMNKWDIRRRAAAKK